MKETQIAKENVENLELVSNRSKLSAKLICLEHKSSCERFLERLNKVRKREGHVDDNSNFIKIEEKDNQNAIKVYEENGIK